MKWTNYSLFALITLCFSCNGQAPLAGKLSLPTNDQWAKKIYLIQARNLDEVAASYLGLVIDSAEIRADGYFAFPKLPNSPSPALFELAVQKKGEAYPNKFNNEDPRDANYFPVIWKNGDHLTISASIEHFQASFLMQNPTPENAALLQLRDIRIKAFEQFKKITNSANHEENQLLETEKAYANFQKPLMDFAQNTTHLLPALVAMRWVSPNQDFERIPEFLVTLGKKWQSGNAQDPWVQQLLAKTDPARLPIILGDKLPNERLPMQSGDTMSLYSLIDSKKLVLLDLWASWCAPCRRENRETLVPLWEKHHQKGFEIIAYALDASQQAWEKAIQADGAYRWKHASHLRGDDAPLLEALRIQTIPSNFLVNTQGEILAKNVHGEALLRLVESYLGK